MKNLKQFFTFSKENKAGVDAAYNHKILFSFNKFGDSKNIGFSWC